MSPRRWAILLLASLLALTLALALGFAPFVRSRASSRADQLGASLLIGSVRPAWTGVRLSDVTVSIPAVPSISLHFGQILVSSDRSVHASHGQLTVHGAPQEVAAQLRQWRDAHSTPVSGNASGHTSPPLEISGLALDWTDALGPGTRLHADDVSVPDLRHLDSVRLGLLEVLGPQGSLRAEGLEVGWARGGSALVRLVRADRVLATVNLGSDLLAGVGSAAPPIGSHPASSISAVGPVATAPPARSPSPSAPPAAGSATQYGKEPSAPTRLLAVKTAALEVLRGLAERVHPEARLEVGALEVKAQRGADRLTLGPGPFEAFQKDGALVVGLAPGSAPGKSGVTFRAEIPLGEGNTRLDVVGGPISLATVGVQEGDLGLTRIEKTSLEVDLHLTWMSDGRSVAFDGGVRAKDVNVKHARLADGTVEGLAVAAKVRGSVQIDGSFLELEDSEFDVGSVQLQLDGTLARNQDRLTVDLAFGIPLVSCQMFLDALPTALIPVVKGMAAAGTLSLKGRIRFDPSRPKDFFLDYAASNDCRVTSVPPAIDVARFRSPFRRKVYGPDGKQMEVESGPGTPGWTSINAMSRYLEVAVMTTEDGRFRTHRGFDHEAIRNSVRENLIQRKFVRGASTISMQLAKNLYLDRRKTVSRKLQELILTAYLEQALTKDQILELYLNAIEFGPMVYGAGPAAYHYFHTSPSSLSLGQALYLSSILPNPAHQHFGAGGRVSEGWMTYLHRLMKNAERRQWITSEELAEGQSEWVIYGSPAPERLGDGGKQPGEAGPDDGSEEPEPPDE